MNGKQEKKEEKVKKRNIRGRSRLAQGSLTVEGSFIASYVTLIIFLVIVLDLFVSLRAIDTLSACETAATFECTGRKTSDCNAEETKLQTVIAASPLLRARSQNSVSRNGSTLSVQISGSMTPPWFLGEWSYSGQISVKQIQPVKKIRKVRMVKNLFQNGESET